MSDGIETNKPKSNNVVWDILFIGIISIVIGTIIRWGMHIEKTEPYWFPLYLIIVIFVPLLITIFYYLHVDEQKEKKEREERSKIEHEKERNDKKKLYSANHGKEWFNYGVKYGYLDPDLYRSDQHTCDICKNVIDNPHNESNQIHDDSK